MNKHWYFCYTVTDNSGEEVKRLGSSVIPGETFSVSSAMDQMGQYLERVAWFDTQDDTSKENYVINITNQVSISGADFDALKDRVDF